MKKQPQRTCMGCNAKKDKKDLIRIVKNKNGQITIDKTGKLEGRGAYICDNKDCLEKIIKNKRLERVFDMQISNEIYESLRGVMIEQLSIIRINRSSNESWKNMFRSRQCRRRNKKKKS